MLLQLGVKNTQINFNLQFVCNLKQKTDHVGLLSAPNNNKF